MKNKRGLSQVVTTLLLVLLIMVAVGGIWLAVSALIDSGAEKINLDKFTLGLTLKKAVIDYDTGLADVRVRRDSGEGDLRGIKFIVEDDKNSEIFEELFDEFPELAERTFTLNLSENEFLTLNKIHKISIAPVFGVGEGGNLKTGEIAGSIGDLNRGINGTDGGDEELPNPNQDDCKVDLDCGSPYFVDGTVACNDAKTAVVHTERVPSCELGFCVTNTIFDVVKEDCAAIDNICYDGNCVPEAVGCTVDADCGTDGTDGGIKCHGTLNATSQDYKDYSCVDSVCEVSIIEQVVENCTDGQICFDGACFTPLECTSNPDCCPADNTFCGRVCEDGTCVDELVINSGIINTAWPPGIGEYFDSADLNSLDKNVVYTGYTLIFPGSAQSECLLLRDFVHVSENDIISYVRLNVPNTNISAGDNYELWETQYACTL